ncbi:hypothetical protein B0J11DRAFT_516138 [Dendryphion nanum]|uniref:Secreted protein n=1 Tax=Dendryphion nanum TaxID=256645 RepID=A0A9P9ELH9_9PLEO|nr:hypothetical protein B0J11DRAFT_516138 [Dendryphion nanum]
MPPTIFEILLVGHLLVTSSPIGNRKTTISSSLKSEFCVCFLAQITAFAHRHRTYWRRRGALVYSQPIPIHRQIESSYFALIQSNSLHSLFSGNRYYLFCISFLVNSHSFNSQILSY